MRLHILATRTAALAAGLAVALACARAGTTEIRYSAMTLHVGAATARDTAARRERVRRYWDAVDAYVTRNERRALLLLRTLGAVTVDAGERGFAPDSVAFERSNRYFFVPTHADEVVRNPRTVLAEIRASRTRPGAVPAGCTAMAFWIDSLSIQADRLAGVFVSPRPSPAAYAMGRAGVARAVAGVLREYGRLEVRALLELGPSHDTGPIGTRPLRERFTRLDSLERALLAESGASDAEVSDLDAWLGEGQLRLVPALANEPLTAWAALAAVFRCAGPAAEPGPAVAASLPTLSSSAAGIELAGRGTVPRRVVVLDVAGRVIRSLPGWATRWDLRDEAGAVVPPGLYFGRREYPDSVRTVRVLVREP